MARPALRSGGAAGSAAEGAGRLHPEQPARRPQPAVRGRPDHRRRDHAPPRRLFGVRRPADADYRDPQPPRATVSRDGMLRLDYALKAGRYPVHIVTARPRYEEGFEVVAWEENLLRSDPVTHWEPAIPAGHSAKELKPGAVFTFVTDGGGAGF